MKIIVCKGCLSKMEAVDERGDLACSICIGIDKNSGVPIEVEVDMSNVRCGYCGTNLKDSEWAGNSEPPFFQYDPKTKSGSFYCGCRGWD
jgi:hypothetical protein